MRKTVLHILALLLLLSGCHSRREAKCVLLQAESVVDNAPDSALALLESVGHPDDRFGKADFMQFEVILVKSKYKCYKPIYADTLIFDSYHFFLDEKDFAKASQAALYGGCVNVERNHFDAAMECFKNADFYAEKVSDSSCRAFAQYYIGDLLNQQGDENQAIDAYRQSERLYGIDYSRRSRCLNAMAMMFLVLGETDSAFYYLDSAMEMAETKGCQNMKSALLNNYSVAYQQIGDFGNAERCLKQAINEVDASQQPIAYLNLAKVYQRSGQSDSLKVYKQLLLNGLDSLTSSQETRAAIYAFLSSAAASEGDFESAYQYELQHGKVTLDIMEERERSSVYDIQQKYDFEAQQNRHNLEMLRRLRVIIVLVIVLLAAMIAVAVLVGIALKRKRIEAELNGKLLELKRQNEEQQKQQHLRDSQFASLEKDELLQKLNVAIQMLSLSNNKSNPMLFKDLEAKVYEGTAPWEYIEMVFNRLNPGWTENIRRQYPDLSEVEFKYCLLSHFSLSRQEFANAMGCSVYYIDKIRANLNKDLH